MESLAHARSGVAVGGPEEQARKEAWRRRTSGQGRRDLGPLTCGCACNHLLAEPLSFFIVPCIRVCALELSQPTASSQALEVDEATMQA